MQRIKSEALDSILSQEFKVLDHGFVRLIDYMGDDSSIVQAARVSYGEGTKKTSDDRSLIRYLMRNRHTTPFEMCEIKIHVKLPIFIARQWMRHRTGSFNEVSGRYSEIKDESYIPGEDRFTNQSDTNKQGSSDSVIYNVASVFRSIKNSLWDSRNYYENLISSGLNRETSRIVLPLSTYTEFYWKVNLHNLLHFLQLRMDSHAQWEIRQYANVIADIVKQWVPHAWEAFVDYRLEAVTFSRMEVELLRDLLRSDEDGLWTEEGQDFQICLDRMSESGMSRREIKDFLYRFE